MNKEIKGIFAGFLIGVGFSGMVNAINRVKLYQRTGASLDHAIKALHEANDALTAGNDALTAEREKRRELANSYFRIGQQAVIITEGRPGGTNVWIIDQPEIWQTLVQLHGGYLGLDTNSWAEGDGRPHRVWTVLKSD